MGNFILHLRNICIIFTLHIPEPRRSIKCNSNCLYILYLIPNVDDIVNNKMITEFLLSIKGVL